MERVRDAECEASHLSPALAWAVMREESAFDPDARSAASAIGLMQLIAPTARLVARDTPWPWDELSLHRPDVSIALGARLLASLRGSFPIHPALAIAAYNSGGGAVRRWLQARGTDAFDVFVERIPFDETRAYVKRVLASEAAYAYLYDPANIEELFAVPATAAPQPRGGGGVAVTARRTKRPRHRRSHRTRTPRSSIEHERRRATTTWSSSGVPTRAAASASNRVKDTSSGLGHGSPLG